MSSVLVLSGDKGIVELVERAIAPGSHLITAMSPEAWTLDCFAAASVDLVFLEDRPDSMTADHFETVVTHCRSQDIPVLLFRESETGQLPKHLDCMVGDYLSLPFDLSEIAWRTEVFLKVKQRIDQLRAQAVFDELTGAYNRRFLHEQLKGAARGSAPPPNHRFIDPVRSRSLQGRERLFWTPVRRHRFERYGRFGETPYTQGRHPGALRRGGVRCDVAPHRPSPGRLFWQKGCGSRQPDTSTRNGGRSQRITISLGVASFPLDEAGSVEELIECADLRLYKAKDSGRNRLVFD